VAFFYTCKKPKLSIYLQPYFATSVVAQVAFFYAHKNPNLSKALLRHFIRGSGGVFTL